MVIKLPKCDDYNLKGLKSTQFEDMDKKTLLLKY